MEKPDFQTAYTKEDIFSACLLTLEKVGWKRFSFGEASHITGIPLSCFYPHFLSASAVLTYLFQKIDEEVLQRIDIPDNLPPKDALFDILMVRFEVAHPYKPILQSVWQELIFTPEETPSLAAQGFCSMAWMLEVCKVEHRGVKGFLRLQGLNLLYILTLRIWLGDDTPDLGKTMVFLDKGLSRLEQAASFLETFGV